jgi:hypothetical protein
MKPNSFLLKLMHCLNSGKKVCSQKMWATPANFKKPTQCKQSPIERKFGQSCHPSYKLTMMVLSDFFAGIRTHDRVLKQVRRPQRHEAGASKILRCVIFNSEVFHFFSGEIKKLT